VKKMLRYVCLGVMISAICVSTGCVGTKIEFESVSKGQISGAGRQISGEAGGFQLLMFFPVSTNSRHRRAKEALMQQARGDLVTDIKVTESWTYAYFGTFYTTRLDATAYPRR